MKAFTPKTAVQYTSAGQQTQGAIYYPDGEARAPAVLLLPTAMGLTYHEHAMAARLAREGYVAMVIAYQKRTTAAVINDDEKRKQLEQITMDGLRFLQADHRTDADHTAVIGFSLGGYFAVRFAFAIKERVPKAVVIYYGVYAFPESTISTLRAPLLILQGTNDSADFVANARLLQELSDRYHKACDVVWYQGVGHQFDLFEPNSPATQRAWDATLAFLKGRLDPTMPGSTVE